MKTSCLYGAGRMFTSYTASHENSSNYPDGLGLRWGTDKMNPATSTVLHKVSELGFSPLLNSTAKPYYKIACPKWTTDFLLKAFFHVPWLDLVSTNSMCYATFIVACRSPQ
jgi:hypothetical protein